MAKEINTNLKVTIASLGNSQSAGSVASTEDLPTGGECIGFRATIGNSTAAGVSLGAGITTPKVVYIQNLDPVNFVTFDTVIGLTAWPQKIFPGTAAVLRPLTGTLFAKADTAPVNVWIVAG